MDSDTYDNTHRAFLQAFLAHSSLTFTAARPILAAIQTVHDPERPTLPNDITNEDFLAYIHTLNSAISSFDLEIRSAKPQILSPSDRRHARQSANNDDDTTSSASRDERIYALVNASGDPISQLATTYTPEELAYIKRVLDAMFDTYNTTRAEVCAVTSIQASQLHKPPRGRESTVGSGQNQGGQAQGITMAQADRVRDGLVEEGWLVKSSRNYYSLSTRALMELRGWLVDTYNEPADEEGEEGVERVKSCYACKEIVISGQRCPNRECLCRLHDFCTASFFQMQRSRTCPLCKAGWDDHSYVGERAVKGSDTGRRTTNGSRSTTNQTVESEDEDD
ncbi:MAG: hypothetical protein M1820_005634 [Bogoriella megaspora]|nr:MAG: hypothetical protein M1820_005634 [Bogoriella megaspora]